MKTLHFVTLKFFLAIVIVSTVAEVPHKDELYPGYFEALNSTILNLISQLRVYTKYLDQAFQPLQTYDKVFPQKLNTFKIPEKPNTSVEDPVIDVPNSHKGDTGHDKIHITEPVPESAAAGVPLTATYNEKSPTTEIALQEGPDDGPSQNPDIRDNITTTTHQEPPKTEAADELHFAVAGSHLEYDSWFDVDVRFGETSKDESRPPSENENHGSLDRKILPEYPNCGVKEDVEEDRKQSQVALGTEEEQGFSLTCGGTLISPTTILTSASLLMNENVTVARTHCSGFHRISQVILHPRFIPGSMYNDLAIIKLTSPVDVVPEALPCVPSAANESEGKWLSTEWRFVTRRGSLSLNTKQVPSNIVPSSTCEDSYRKYLDLRELDFKLSFPQGIVDSLQCVSAVEQRQCEFKKGYQLLRQSEPQGSWSLVGTRVNIDFYCDDFELPGVYTNIHAFKDWIAENF